MRIDFRNGHYCGIGTFEERHVWKQAGFRWSGVRRCWVTEFEEVAKKVNCEWSQRAHQEKSLRQAVNDISVGMSYAYQTDFRSPVPPGLHPRTGKQYEPFRYQDAGVEYFLKRKDSLCADQPGLGKTLQAILLFNADETVQRVLIIAPAGLKAHWKREFDLWKMADVSVGIAHATKRERIQVGVTKKGKPKFKWHETKDYWPDTDVVIINYNILERFEEQIQERVWDLLVVDEAHALKNAESSRTLRILGGSRLEKYKDEKGKERRKRVRYNQIEANRRLFLTGTPIMNRPIELWPLIQACDPNGLGRNWEEYVTRYCEGWFDSMRGTNGAWVVDGASNLEELGQRLREAFMVRRLRKDVQPDLPDKFRQVICVESPEITELVARENELAEALKLYELAVLNGNMSVEEQDGELGTQIVNNAIRSGLAEALSDPDKPNARKLDMEYMTAVTGLEPPAIAILFEEIAKVRRELGIAKLSAVTPWIEEFLEGGEKLVVFAYHSDVVKALAASLEKYQPAVIWGGVPVDRRQAIVDRFQDDEDCRVIICNIDAGGVGYTMTAAATICFVEGDWVPSKLEQCYDRICRIGQTALKLIGFFLVANGSLDCKIAQSAQAKEENISAVMDT